MLRKITDFIVEKRLLILALMLALAVAGAICSQFVEINKDMTKYLPDNSSMKTGIDIMTREFPAAETSNTIRVMADDLNSEQKQEVLERLRAIEHVDSVDYDPDSTAYQKDNHTLYVLHMSCDYDSDEEAAINRALETQFDGYQVVWKDDNTGNMPLPTRVVVVVLIVMLIILFAMCGSWLEPILFLGTIGIAVMINAGTNLILGSVADVTNGIASILQMVLSMDYSIILMNRYRQERVLEPDKTIAMKNALANAFSSVASSALTTVVGLLMLVFMSFKIGLNLGVVLAKGVFLSMVCVLTILPALILACDKALTKTAKKSLHVPMDWAARYSHRMRYAVTAVFVLLFIVTFLLQRQTGIDYTLVKDDPVAVAFPRDNTMVLVYENEDEAKLSELYDALEQDTYVKSAMGYGNVFAKAYTSQELAGLMKNMGGELPLDPSVINLLYYIRFSGGETGAMTMNEFFTFVMNNETIASYMDSDLKDKAKSGMGSLMGAMVSGKKYTAAEMGQLLSGMVDGVDPAMIELLYLYKDSTEASDPAWAMTVDELFRFVCDDILSDPRFSALINDAARQSILGAQDSLDAAKAQLVGQNYSRLIITTSYPDEGEKTEAFLKMLENYSSRLAGKSYLIGNSAMAFEMRQTFGDEYLFITLLTAFAIFLIVAITFRSISVPAILVLLVQCGIFITVTVTGIISGGMYYLALLIVECILMGATIDYGILFTNYFREARRTLDITGALKKAYAGSIHTILTSGLILVLVTEICGRMFEDKTIAEIVSTLAIGAFSAIVLILFVLPGILSACDKLVTRKTQRFEP